MKRRELLFAVILLPLDYLMLVSAGVLAYRIRFEALAVAVPATSLIPFPSYFEKSLLVAVAWIGIFALNGLYTLVRPRRVLDEIVRVVSGCTVGVMGIILLVFFRRELFASRFVVLAAWGLAMLLVIAGRLLVRVIQYFMFRSGLLSHRVIIIGSDDPATAAVMSEFSRHPERGYAIVKRVSAWTDSTAAELDELHQTIPLDELFVTDPTMHRKDLEAVIEFAEDRHLTFRYAADTFASHAILRTTTVAGIPVVEVVRTRLDGWGRVYKRVFDIVGSLVLIIISSPIMLLTAIAVSIGSRGPIIFRNERVGQEGRLFDALKFRSMLSQFSVGRQFGDQKAALAYEQQLIREHGLKEGPVYKIKDDPRVTRVGAFIRRYSIDELPQLFNVLAGSMSLVGPRPHQPREVAKYERDQRRVLTIKPGITGIAQVSGRSNLAFEEESRLDRFYIENWTPILDLAILLKTPLAVTGRKGAY